MTVLPRIMVMPEIETGELCVRPMDVVLEMMAVEPKGRVGSIAVSSLIDALAAELGRTGNESLLDDVVIRCRGQATKR